MNKQEINTSCVLCPRACKANREQGKTGYCGMASEIVIARASLHMWEEPCISGKTGSGTVFFTGCPLRCVFCQNRDIAIGRMGKVISLERLVEIFFELKEQGANNINLVTPTHYVPQIQKALMIAKEQGLNLPIVYNTSSYETVDTLKMLDGLVDIYLPDMKYHSSELSKKYSNAPDYFEVADQAIAEMVRQVGPPVFEKDMIQRGVIVRHMILPGNTKDSKRIIDHLLHTYKNDIYVSIMNQYTPMPEMAEYPEINRKITKREYQKVIDYAIESGLEKGFIQEGETAMESFIPDFHENRGIEKESANK